MNRRKFTLLLSGTIFSVSGCLSDDQPDTWNLGIHNETPDPVQLDLEFLQEEEKEPFYSERIEIDVHGIWHLREDFDVKTKATIRLDIVDGTEVTHLWEDPDGASTLNIEIISAEEVEFEKFVS